MKFSYLYGAYGSPVRYNVDSYKDKTRIIIAALLCCVLVAGIAASQLIHTKSGVVEASPAEIIESQTAEKPPTTEESQAVQSATGIKDYQGVIDNWVKSHKGTYGVVVADTKSETLGSSGANQEFFMASIYKLYVAYLSYQKVDEGVFKLDEPYWNDWTRGKCLDEMIRSSHNQCGEKMMLELGKEFNAKLKSYGLANTSTYDFSTTAQDAAIILARVHNGTNLSSSSHKKLLDSMIGQQYRDGLPKGFTGMDVYDKVGFREKSEYHDVGIVKLPNGSFIIVSIMSKDAGVNNIAGLAQSIAATTR